MSGISLNLIDIKLYIVFIILLTHLLSLLKNWKLNGNFSLGKVEIAIYCCVAANIWTEMFLELSSNNHMNFPHVIGLFVHYTSSSVWVAGWLPLGK